EARLSRVLTALEVRLGVREIDALVGVLALRGSRSCLRFTSGWRCAVGSRCGWRVGRICCRFSVLFALACCCCLRIATAPSSATSCFLGLLLLPALALALDEGLLGQEQ